jgi:hypothetical protein
MHLACASSDDTAIVTRGQRFRLASRRRFQRQTSCLTRFRPDPIPKAVTAQLVSRRSAPSLGVAKFHVFVFAEVGGEGFNRARFFGAR